MPNYEPITPPWGANLHRMPKRHLRALLKRYEALHAHKVEVLSKHKPGTTYYTRARGEADHAQARIEIIRAVLQRKEE